MIAGFRVGFHRRETGFPCSPAVKVLINAYITKGQAGKGTACLPPAFLVTEETHSRTGK